MHGQEADRAACKRLFYVNPPPLQGIQKFLLSLQGFKQEPRTSLTPPLGNSLLKNLHSPFVDVLPWLMNPTAANFYFRVIYQLYQTRRMVSMQV
jgi:hypothetical protein